jgi:hypothetical protein
MEQDQNVLAVTRSLDQKAQGDTRMLAHGVDIVAAYDRSAWIWRTLKEFFGTLVTELVRADPRHIAVPWKSENSAGQYDSSSEHPVSPLCRCSCPVKTINLFSLAGLCIAIGEIADATIVHVENVAAELSIRKNLTIDQRREVVIPFDHEPREAADVLAADHPCSFLRSSFSRIARRDSSILLHTRRRLRWLFPRCLRSSCCRSSRSGFSNVNARLVLFVTGVRWQ